MACLPLGSSLYFSKPGCHCRWRAHFPFLPSCLRLTTLCRNLRTSGGGVDEGDSGGLWKNRVTTGSWFGALVSPPNRACSMVHYRNSLRYQPTWKAASRSPRSLFPDTSLPWIIYLLSTLLRQQTFWKPKPKSEWASLPAFKELSSGESQAQTVNRITGAFLHILDIKGQHSRQRVVRAKALRSAWS